MLPVQGAERLLAFYIRNLTRGKTQTHEDCGYRTKFEEQNFFYVMTSSANFKQHNNIHLIQKRLSTVLLHCTLRIVAYPDRKAPWM